MTAISKFSKNRMGTIDIHMKLPNMRKEQDFIVYPIHKGNNAKVLTIQSDTRFGQIDLETGIVTVTPARPNGAYGHDYTIAKINNTLTAHQLTPDELTSVKLEVLGTTDQHAGSNGIMYTDNSGAINILS